MNQTSSNRLACSVLASLASLGRRHTQVWMASCHDQPGAIDVAFAALRLGGTTVVVSHEGNRHRPGRATWVGAQPFDLIDSCETLGHLQLPVAGLGAAITAAASLAYRIYTSGSSEQPKEGRILCGGEALSRNLAEALLARVAALWDVYVPTEPAVWSTLANSELHVVDYTAVPGPLGAAERLAVVSERFVPDPYSGEPGARLNRTRDLARHLPAGRLESLSRRDHQVKIGGYRIELGEIAAALEPESDAAPATKELRRFLSAVLPSFRVPAAFVASNGKLDRRALPAPQWSAEAAGGFAAPILKQAPREGPLPFSFAQQCLWFLAQLDPQSAACILAQTIRVTGWLAVPALSWSLGEVARRHQALRTTFAEIAGESWQMIGAAEAHYAACCQGQAPVLPELPVQYADYAVWQRRWLTEGALKSRPAYWRGRLRELPTDRPRPAVQAFRGTTLPVASPAPLPAAGRPERSLACALHFQALFNLQNAPRAAQAEMISALVVGLAGRFPGAGSVPELWEKLCTGSELITFFSREEPAAAGEEPELLDRPDYAPAKARLADVDQLDAVFFGQSPQEAEILDPQQRLFLEAAWEALVNAGYDPQRAGGVSVSVPAETGCLYRPGSTVSPDGHCRAFDARAHGAVPSNGLGIVALKRLDGALRVGDTIRAVILDSAMNNYGAGKVVGYTAPSVDGQVDVITSAPVRAGVAAGTIGYVEAHGTGTPLGDPIEVAALKQVCPADLAPGSVTLGSNNKTNLEHLAAGVTGLIKAVLALEHGEIPSSLHFKAPSLELGLDSSPFRANAEAVAWPRGATPRRAGVSSFGIGGTNINVVLEEAPTWTGPSEHPTERPHVLVLAACPETALTAADRLLVSFKAGGTSERPAIAHRQLGSYVRGAIRRRGHEVRWERQLLASSAALDNLVSCDTSGSARLPNVSVTIRRRSAAWLVARKRRWVRLSSEASTKGLAEPAERLAAKPVLSSRKGPDSRIARAWTTKEVEKAKPNRRSMLSGIRKRLGIEEVEP